MMTATQCPTTDRLKALSLGCLNEHESDEMFEHLRSCDACKSELETIDDQDDSLIGHLRAADPDSNLDNEPDCKVALAKALGALAVSRDSVAATDFPLPQTIGEYEIVRPIGCGGMGSVYLARHTKLGREVALKVLASHRLADAKIQSRFDAEMQAVGRLSHPNIVTAHDAREVDGLAVLVTEFIDGFDLGQLVNRTGPLKIADACEIISKIAAALQYTSDQGFVHRDVKPSNIMLSRDGEVKLLDLGLARLTLSGDDSREITGTGQAIGTADFIAPEQVTDSRSVDWRADIYSLGCTLFKLLTGQAPFGGANHATAFAKMTAHVSTPPPSVADFRDDIPPAIQKLIAKTLAKTPDDRPQSLAEISKALAKYSNSCDLSELVQRAADTTSDASVPVTSTTSAKTQPWFRRRVPIAVAIATGFFGGVVGLLLGLFVEITYPDGTKIKVPIAGATVEIVDDGVAERETRKAVKLPTDSPVTVEKNQESRFDKLMLAVCAQETEINGGIDSALAALKNGKFDRDQPSLIWVPIDEGVNAPVTGRRDGKRHALIKATADACLIWSHFKDHVVGATNGSQEITVRFDDQLAQKVLRITEVNHQRDLAVVINGRIVQAPRILTSLSKAFSITGKFSFEERAELTDAFESAMPAEAPKDQAKEQLSAHERLQGIWLTPESVPGINNASQQIWMFDGNHFAFGVLTGRPDFGVESGTFSTQAIQEFAPIVPVDDQWKLHTVAYHDPPLDVKCFLKDGILTMLFDDNDANTEFKLTRVADIPASASQIQALTKGITDVNQMKVLNPMLQAQAAGLAKSTQALKQFRYVGAFSESRKNLQMLALGFHNYHSAYQTFPGSQNYNDRAIGRGTKDIQPFSWRVAILPFIKEVELYEQYDITQAWDSEHNSKMLTKMPAIFRSPRSGADQPSDHTNYLGYATGASALGQDGGISMRDIRDGTSNTILLVETKNTVPWTKPEDLGGDAEFFSPMLYALADGSVIGTEKIDAEALAKMITRDGGETLESSR